MPTTDKARRKRTPKIDDNIDGQKVKRRKSDMNMNQQKQQDPPMSTPPLTSIEKKTTTDTNKVRTKKKKKETNEYELIAYIFI